nr:MAG TPA: hypothetical protein [Caudoviricetes sp.]
MSRKSKSKEKQMKAQAEQFKYKGMTKAQIQKAKKEERAVWVAVFDDKRKKNDKKELKKILDKVMY